MSIETTVKYHPSESVYLGTILSKEMIQGKLAKGGIGHEPPKLNVRLINAVRPIVVLSIFLLLYVGTDLIIQYVADAILKPTEFLDRGQATTQALLKLSRLLLAGTILGAAFIYVLFELFSDIFKVVHSDKELDRTDATKHQDEIIESIYYRLRYVEADHVVFDPVSGMQTPATLENILTMLRTLSASMNDEKR